jgi:hypothetical protein
LRVSFQNLAKRANSTKFPVNFPVCREASAGAGVEVPNTIELPELFRGSKGNHLLVING